MKKLTAGLAAAVMLLLMLSGCQSDWPEMGANGNSDLSQVDFRNMTLIPPLDAKITNYYLVQSTNTAPFDAIVLTRLYATSLRINGGTPINKRTYYNTNNLGYPTYTPITPLTDGAVSGLTNGRFVFVTTAQDGTARTNTVWLLGEKHDASISSLLVQNGGTPYPTFNDGIAPDFTTDATSGGYELVAADNFALGAQPRGTGAKVYLVTNNTTNEITAGTAASVSVPTNGTVQQYRLLVVSESGAFTNSKLFKVQYISKNADTRLTNITILSGTEKLKPGFYFNQTNYKVIYEDKAATGFAFYKAYPEQTLEVDSGDGTWTTVAVGQQSYELSAVSVTMGRQVRARVTSINGGQRIYTIEFMSFTTTPYDFDGRIKQYIEQVKITGEKTEKFTNITGIITVMDYFGYNDAPQCYFLEDRNYGLYIFLQIGKDPFDSKFKLGHKVTLDIPDKGSKVYYGMPEAIDYTSLRFADESIPDADQPRHSIHVIPKPDFYNPTSLARMHRFTGRVNTEMNTRQVGFFEPLNGGPLVQFHINDPVYYNQMIPWLQPGATGTFYGPVLWSWGNYQFELVSDDYTIIDGR